MMKDKPTFNPQDYKSYDDLPGVAKQYFTQVDRGFVLKSAVEELEKAEKAEKVFKEKNPNFIICNIHRKSPIDILQEQAEAHNKIIDKLPKIRELAERAQLRFHHKREVDLNGS